MVRVGKERGDSGRSFPTDISLSKHIYTQANFKANIWGFILAPYNDAYIVLISLLATSCDSFVPSDVLCIYTDFITGRVWTP